MLMSQDVWSTIVIESLVIYSGDLDQLCPSLLGELTLHGQPHNG